MLRTEAGSDNPCSDEYRGGYAEEADEVKNLVDNLSKQGKIRSYISVVDGNGYSVTPSDKLDETLQSPDRHELFLAEKMSNAMGRFGFNDPFKFGRGEQDLSGSSFMYFRHEASRTADYAYQISLSDEIITSEADIEASSLVLVLLTK